MIRGIALLLLAGWTASAADRPNFLVIFTDDQCYRAIGYHNEQVKTPHLDRLAGEGMIIENCYVASPICAASRASMMTGLYPQQHGVIALASENFEPYRKGGDKAGQTLAAQLGKAGYHCMFAGKSHLGDPKTYGFAEGSESKDPRDFDAFADATKFLEKAATMEQPFLLWLAPRQPHVPLIPDPKWLDLYDEKAIELSPNFRESPLKESITNQGKAGENFYRDSDYTRNWRNLPSGPPRDEETMKQFIKAYYATISHLDSQVGALVERLDELGLGEDTLIIYLSDNGYHLGSHGLGNKITMHEESVRVPMWMRQRGMEEAGTKYKDLVSSLDVYSTLIDLAGGELPPHAMGRSMASGRGPFDEVMHQSAVFSECTGVGGRKGEGHRMVRWKDMKLILTDTNERRFFHLGKDPIEVEMLPLAENEDENLAAQATLMNLLKEWQQAIGDREPH